MDAALGVRTPAHAVPVLDPDLALLGEGGSAFNHKRRILHVLPALHCFALLFLSASLACDYHIEARYGLSATM